MATPELSQAGRAAKTGCESLFQRLLHSLDYLWTSREATQQGACAYSLRCWKRAPQEEAAQSAALCCIAGVLDPGYLFVSVWRHVLSSQFEGW